MKNKYSIYGAMIGDVYGSMWEFCDRKPSKDECLKLVKGKSSATDDTIMTAAIADAVMNFDKLVTDGYAHVRDHTLLYDLICSSMKHYGRKFPSSYGVNFANWIASEDTKPYWSKGNGCCMRLSPAVLSSNIQMESLVRATIATQVTHNHPVAIYYSTIMAKIISMLKDGFKKEDVMSFLEVMDGMLCEYVKNTTVSDLIGGYGYTELVEHTFPQALVCFMKTNSFEDCLVASLMIGGDSDTLSAISCSMASSYYSEDEIEPFYKNAVPFVDEEILDTLELFSRYYLW